MGTNHLRNGITDRFFAAVVLAGHLHVRGMPDRGPWDPALLEWATELEIDPNLVLSAGDRKIRTREELEEVMKAPPGAMPARFVWIHKSLVDEVHRLWEHMAAETERPK